MGKRVSLSDVVVDGATDTGDPPKPEDNPSLSAASHAPLSKFVRDPRNHRSKKADPDLADLAARMQRFGQLQPVLVVSAALYRDRFPNVEIPAEAEYVIIAGNRRHSAAELAGIEELYFLLNDDLLNVEDYREAALDENLRRLDLTCIEIARTIGEWVEENTEETQQALGERLNRSQSWVSQHLALLRLPDIVQDYLDVRRVKITPARAIAFWPAERLEEFATALREAAAKGEDAPSPAITAVINPPEPKEKATRKALDRFRTHHGPEKFATLVCAELEPADAAALAVQAVSRLDDAGLEKLRGLLAAPRPASD